MSIVFDGYSHIYNRCCCARGEYVNSTPWWLDCCCCPCLVSAGCVEVAIYCVIDILECIFCYGCYCRDCCCPRRNSRRRRREFGSYDHAYSELPSECPKPQNMTASGSARSVSRKDLRGSVYSLYRRSSQVFVRSGDFITDNYTIYGIYE